MSKGTNFIRHLELVALTIFPCWNYATEIDGPTIPVEGYPIECSKGMNGPCELPIPNKLLTIKCNDLMRSYLLNFFDEYGILVVEIKLIDQENLFWEITYEEDLKDYFSH